MGYSDSVNYTPVDRFEPSTVGTAGYGRDGQVDTDALAARRGDIAHAIAAADAVRIVHSTDNTTLHCLLCLQETEPGLVVTLKSAAVGMSSVDSARFVMICRRCRAAASEDAASAVVELARAGRQVDELLSLLRRRADVQLSGWWGGVGACTREAAEASSVAFRRAVERLKPFLPGVS